ncbi:hypothetical protein BJX63DRAFT_56151 [Aspergillus granulosus]|uniref:Uncharacterized protein n=1 Tax=Aspergillus granulosus TaxID=176169 RepID=A0ABR4GXA3_9EURO
MKLFWHDMAHVYDTRLIRPISQTGWAVDWLSNTVAGIRYIFIDRTLFYQMLPLECPSLLLGSCFVLTTRQFYRLLPLLHRIRWSTSPIPMRSVYKVGSSMQLHTASFDIIANSRRLYPLPLAREHGSATSTQAHVNLNHLPGPISRIGRPDPGVQQHKLDSTGGIHRNVSYSSAVSINSTTGRI